LTSVFYNNENSVFSFLYKKDAKNRMEWSPIKNQLKRRRRRRWRVSKMHPVLKWFLILALIAAAAVIAIKAFYTEPATAQALQTDPPEPHPSTVPSSTKTREAAPTATPFQRRPAEGLLVLINWEHPLTCEVRPADLVPLESVFSQDLVTIDNDDGSVNATAGAAARDMFQAARENGIGRYLITSAYRCVSYQEAFYQEAMATIRIITRFAYCRATAPSIQQAWPLIFYLRLIGTLMTDMRTRLRENGSRRMPTNSDSFCAIPEISSTSPA
jgi:hypothetical protein